MSLMVPKVNIEPTYVDFQSTANPSQLPRQKTRRGYNQEPTLEVIKALTLKLLTRLGYGAGNGDRTRDFALEGRHITAILHLLDSAFTMRPQGGRA